MTRRKALVLCPSCKKKLRGEDNVRLEDIESGKYTMWCLSCAEKLFDPDHLRQAREYAEDCRKRINDPLLVLATLIKLNGSYRCPNCEYFVSHKRYAPVLVSVPSGDMCILCKFFIPDLPDLMFAPDGNFWKEIK